MFVLLACSPNPTPTPPQAPSAEVTPATPVAPPAPEVTPPPPAPSIFATPPVPPAELGAAWVDRGVCPGECCTYGAWTATREVSVVSAPKSAVVLGTIAKDAKVDVATGEVHATPIPGKVLLEHTTEGVTVRPGDVVWVLTFTGEGYAKVWENGTIVSDYALFVSAEECRTDPAKDPETCWAAADPREFTPDPWWVKVKVPGLEGWVDNTHDVLTGFDACG